MGTSLNNHEIMSKEAKVNGLRIFYRVAGSGRPLLLLHGSPLTSRSWLGVMTSLAQEYTVVAPDFRGYGKSDKPATGYPVQTMVEDIRELVHQLGMGPVDVVGHDLGGIVAYAYAAKYMQQVSLSPNSLKLMPIRNMLSAAKILMISNDLETLVPFIKNALKYQPELKLWASVWSPPTWMKYNKHYAGRNVRARHAAERPETRTTSPRGD